MNSNVPLYLAHGDCDTLVPHKWAQICEEKLKSSKVETSLRIYNNVGHEIRTDIISDLFAWVERR